MQENLTEKQLTLVANTIRGLAIDGVEKANSGHPGMPMGMAEIATVLWLKYLRVNPKDPKWLNRDRFVLSNGHGSMLLYSMLHLSGYAVTLDDLKSFRQWESITPGHPESYMTPGVECTTGPLGQGIGNAVGMAIAEKIMEARYNTHESSIFDHKIFCFLGDGCLMEGISSEACSLAGHLGLDNLIAIYDNNHISIAGHTDLAFTEDVAKRFDSYGWRVQRINGHSFEHIDEALALALSNSRNGRPTLIIADTKIGKGSPNKVDTHDVHGAPLGAAEVEATKKALNWPLEPTFFVPEEVKKIFAARLEKLSADHEAWSKKFSEWKTKNPEGAKKLNAQVTYQVPENLTELLLEAVPKDGKAVASRKLSEAVIQAASKAVPSFIGGSADLEPSTLTLIKGSTDVEKGEFSGLNLRFGVREHGMGALMNGLSYYGGFIPYGSTFFCFLDYMKPTVRLAALSHLRGVFIYTHDSIFLGEDGPTHQPIEHLATLRATPNVMTFRPCDGVETAVCYALALKRKDGPSAMILSRQNLEPPARDGNTKAIEKGGYSIFESKPGEQPEVVFVATGSEVALAIAAAKKLAVATRVVSMPCAELFLAQEQSYRETLIPRSAKKVVIEAGASFGWTGVVDGNSSDTLVVGIDRFGASAPQKVLAEKYGFTEASVLEAIKKKFGI